MADETLRSLLPDGTDEATPCKHEWVRGPEGDTCKHCEVPWAEAARGFGSNVIPKKLRKLNG